MRIRGYDEETEEFIGGVEQLNGEIASLTKTANSVGGISLFSDKEKTEFKSTTELLREISVRYSLGDNSEELKVVEEFLNKIEDNNNNNIIYLIDYSERKDAL